MHNLEYCGLLSLVTKYFNRLGNIMGGNVVLLVEGSVNIKDTLRVALSRNYQINIVSSLRETLEFLANKRVNIIILDNNIPDIEAKELLLKIRKIGVNAPIIILNSENNLKIKLDYFNSGADDYIAKPFSLGELEAKLHVFSKHILNSTNYFSNQVKTNNLELNKKEYLVTRDGYRTIKLRRKEFEILEYLMLNCNKTISRNSIANYVWSVDYKPWSNSVDVHIKNLRDKIDKPFKRQLIHTVHGYGYKLVNQ